MTCCCDSLRSGDHALCCVTIAEKHTSRPDRGLGRGEDGISGWDGQKTFYPVGQCLSRGFEVFACRGFSVLAERQSEVTNMHMVAAGPERARTVVAKVSSIKPLEHRQEAASLKFLSLNTRSDCNKETR